MATRNTTFKVKMRKAIKRAHKDHFQSPLYETMKMFRSVLGLNAGELLNYDEWIRLDPCYKSAALYVMFFREITLAYYKSRSFYSHEDDNVSIVLQYLDKNVPIIEMDESRYTAKYVYKVAYNCMYCQSRDIKRDRQRYENEVSNITVSTEGDELNLFDFVSSNESIESIINRERFWAIIRSMDDETCSVVENILNGTRLPAGVKQHREYIISNLRVKLARFIDVEF